jgi:sugar (pentulose or hexulose) kinase
MEYAVAVLDIGKTNKKIVIYDEKLNQVDSVYKSIPTVRFEELDVENTEGIESWFYDNLKELSGKYNIRCLSVSAHGATCACVDKAGELAVPVVAYTNEVPEDFHDKFYELVGNCHTLQRETGTAQVKPLINLAQLIYFLQKRFPSDYAKTDRILPYAQFFGYKLTGTAAADYTYTGCHTYLWDFDKWQWSSVAEKLGILPKLPEKLKNPADILGTISPEMSLRTGLKPETIVTVGLHDSNSSLIPYLVKGEKDFILNSTGTWCVVMHPTREYSFSEEEIGKTVFYNISARQELVKTAIFMGGLEFETYMAILQKLNKTDEYPAFSKEVVQSVLDKKSDFIVPGVVKGAGQFPDSEPGVYEGERFYSLDEIRKGRVPEFFMNFKYAHAVLNLSLAMQTAVALDRVSSGTGSPVYIEGGFRRNAVYKRLIAALYPDSPVYTTSIKEASSYGAAIAGKAAYDDVELEDLADLVRIDMNPAGAEELTGLNEYRKGFMERL